MIVVLAAMLVVLLGGGAVLALAGGNDRSKARVAALTKPDARASKIDAGALRKRNMQTALKEFEKKQAEKKSTITTRRRLDPNCSSSGEYRCANYLRNDQAGHDAYGVER